jgi:hypothetical protein
MAQLALQYSALNHCATWEAGLDFILPAVADMAGTMLSSSNYTVSRRISDMAGDVLKQLLLCNL